MIVERTVLPSGIRVVTTTRPDMRSLEIGAWIGTGARDEPGSIAGVSHFIEHLLFKGTARRSAFEIARVFDAVGGDLNAFTTHENTVVHARVLDADLDLAVDVIADMTREALLAPGDVDSERNVVLEEIAMHEDSPEDSVYDLFHEVLWPGHPLGRRVQGEPDTVRAVTRDQLVEWYGAHWRPEALVFAVAGSAEHARIADLVARAYADAPAAGERPARAQDPPATRSGLIVRERDIEQAHVVWGTQGIPRTDDRRWALGVMNTVLGGGMSSRLFQEVREQRGLAYSISSGHQGYTDTGVFTIYAGCSPERTTDVLAIVREEVARVARDGITDEELERAIGQIRGGILVSLDEIGSLMIHVGRGEVQEGRVLPIEEMVRRVEAVTLDDVRAIAREVLTGQPWALALLGPAIEADLSPFTGEAA